MHIDIHYFGTYAMARIAGLRHEACQTIATAAQFVDANDRAETIEFEDGGEIHIVPTAHPLFHMKNTELFERDQRMVWLPFHFLPGNEGKTISERLVCRQNSEIAREMISHCLSLADKEYGLQLVGIAAHVYADTFSHYGFSGVSSRWNRVRGDSITLQNDDRDKDAEDRFQQKYGETMSGLRNWRQRIWDKVQSGVAETGTGALGHGAVMKYPDYPYLKWQFSYEHPEDEERTSGFRDNAATFLEACERLHGLFRRLGPGHLDPEVDSGRGFDSVRGVVTQILENQETDRNIRGTKWADSAEAGDLFAEPEQILPYLGMEWKNRLEEMKDGAESRNAAAEPVFRFFQAAAVYRTYVLRDLLPAHGLVVG